MFFLYQRTLVWHTKPLPSKVWEISTTFFPHPLLYLKSIALSALQPFEIRGQMVLTRASPAADKVIFCSRKAEKVL